jgi:NifU-like protein
MSKASILPQTRDNFKIDSLTSRPQNIGKITKEEANKIGGKLLTYTYGSCEGGLALKFYIVLNEEDKIIDAKLEVFGESDLLAVASIAALIIKNKNGDEILSLKEKGLEYFLRENPNNAAFAKSKRYLTNVVMDAIYHLAYYLKNQELEDGDIVDNFTKTKLNFIKKTIKEFNVDNLQDLSQLTRAGLFDKSCLYPGAGENLSNYYLQDILRETLNEIEQEKKAKKEVVDKPFNDMTTEEKLAAIEAVIEKHIRHMLVMDGGDMEILEIKQNGAHTDIYIRYLGACNGCASASTGTLFAIEGILKQKLDENIRVIPL